MTTYFAYIRVSTKKQGEGSSLQEQQSAIEAYAESHGLRIAGWFEELQTAAKQGRRVFTRMLADLERGKACGVIMHKIDRGARNLKDWAQLNELIDRGIEVRFVRDNLDLNTRGGRLSADLQAVVAADYIRNLRDEVKKGFYGRLKQGLYPLAAPRGYRDEGKGKPKTIDPVKGPLVRRAFELYATGEYTFETLSDEMFASGLCGRGGRRIVKFSLATMLHNPFYIGIIRLSRSGETFQGIHEPLISKALYERVQNIMANRMSPRSQRHRFLYPRMITCAACGYSLVGERQKGHVYYRCHTLTCRGTSIREDLVSATIGAFFELLAFTDEDLRDVRDLADAGNEDLARRTEHQRAQTRLALAQLDDRMLRLTDALVDGLIDKAAFDERKQKLLIERRGLNDQLERPMVSESDEFLKNLELGNMAQRRVETGFIEEIRAALRETTSNLVAYGKNPAIKPGFPFDEIAKVRFSEWCGPDQASARTLNAKIAQAHELPPWAPSASKSRITFTTDGSWMLG